MTEAAPAGGRKPDDPPQAPAKAGRPPAATPAVPGRGLIGADLVARIVSALVLAPAALLATFAPQGVFAAFWLVAAIGVHAEWQRLVVGRLTLAALAIGIVTLGATTFFIITRPGLWVLALLALGVALLFAATPGVFEQRRRSAIGLAYAAGAVLPVVVLHADPEFGAAAVIFVFAVVWATDIAAYFVGRTLRGPKLWPRVSPNKTWSGAMGGVLAATLAGMAVAAAVGVPSLLSVALVSAAASIVGQAGDLYESRLKREVGAKDSGDLIPGHGGLMDRLDGFLAAATFAAAVGLARGGFATPGEGLLSW